MKHAAPQSLSSNLVLVNNSQDGDSTAQTALSKGELSGQNSVFDPHREAREMPLRWKAYCRAHYGEHQDLIPIFRVDDKTARNWWNGKGGVRADRQTLALKMHPDTAPQILLGPEYSIAAE